MRYWIKNDGSDYSLSQDDMSRLGYIEITERPATYPDMWKWDFAASKWEMDKARYLTQLAVNRLKHEQGGIVVDGKQYDTTDRSRIALIALVQYAPETVEYKMVDGSYVSLTVDDVKALFDKMMAFTLLCFAQEKVVREAVTADTHTIEMLDNDWPANDMSDKPEETSDNNPSE